MARTKVFLFAAVTFMTALAQGCGSSSSNPTRPTAAKDAGTADAGAACTPEGTPCGSAHSAETCCLNHATTASTGKVSFSGVCTASGACTSGFAIGCTTPSGCGADEVCCASLTFPEDAGLSRYLPPRFDLGAALSQLNPVTGFGASGFGLQTACVASASCSGSQQIQICVPGSTAQGATCSVAGDVCYSATAATGASLSGVAGCVPRKWLGESDAGTDAANASSGGTPGGGSGGLMGGEGGASGASSGGAEQSGSGGTLASGGTVGSSGGTLASGGTVGSSGGTLASGGTVGSSGGTSGSGGTLASGGTVGSSGGATVVTCSLAATTCSGQNIDPCTAPFHCGAGANCTANPGADCYDAPGGPLDCVDGKCVCPIGAIMCGLSCVYPSSSSAYCGAKGDCTGDNAGKKCPVGESCVNSNCECNEGLVLCNGTCISPLSSNANCGAKLDCQGLNAGTNCGKAECLDGQCGCPQNQALCSAGCTDPLWDSANCGAAVPGCTGGKVCTTASGQGCTDGVCAGPCTAVTNVGTSIGSATLYYQAPPITPQGGPITSGTYVAISEVTYISNEGTASPVTFTDDRVETAVIDATAKTIEDITDTTVSSYTIDPSGTALNGKETCGPNPVATSAFETLYWSNYTGYTATANAFQAYLTLGGTDTTILTFTKKP